MGREADAARRRGVEAFGFKFLVSSEAGVEDVAKPLEATAVHLVRTGKDCRALQVEALAEAQKRRM